MKLTSMIAVLAFAFVANANEPEDNMATSEPAKTEAVEMKKDDHKAMGMKKEMKKSGAKKKKHKKGEKSSEGSH
jgi:hypothetical protein